MSDADLKAATASLTLWFEDDALPLWWTKGADLERGGFYELLAQNGEPLAVDRRARVQARQIYTYAMAGRLGWSGPWKAAVSHGLEFFLAKYRRPDGLFRTKAHADGSPADDTAWLYDQAFALLALAEASQALPERGELRPLAHAVVSALSDWRLPASGFREAAKDQPFQSNPHMHLLEACLAWAALDGDPIWNRLVDEIVGLCLTKFIDADGALHEFFAEDWSGGEGVEGRIVEPGHQFEWAWLLARWSRLRDRPDALSAARRLFEIGRDHGVDRRRGVAFDQLLDDFSIHQPGARLWPQTERIKAAAILARLETDPARQGPYLKDAVEGVEGLRTYLDVPVQGLWRDKMRPDGTFVDEPAPASSFYHITCAIAELNGILAD